MNELGTSLEDLRAEIDRIDTDLHGLIKRRAALVEKIRAVKARDSITVVRPGREADILRTLSRRHDGAFPFPAIARIWREIIANITRMEMPDYSVAVFAGGDTPEIWDLARNQFGSATPMTPFGTTREVLGEVAAERATIGVLPCPREGDDDPWWTNIAVREGVRVSYKLPFVAADGDGGQAALAIGRIVPETSGDDRTLVVVETEQPLSRAGVTGLAERVGLRGHPIASSVSGPSFQLLDIEGYITDDDGRIDDLSKLNDVAQATVIGSYATPLTPSSGTGLSS